jgi:hypothetical protein
VSRTGEVVRVGRQVHELRVLSPASQELQERAEAGAAHKARDAHTWSAYASWMVAESRGWSNAAAADGSGRAGADATLLARSTAAARAALPGTMGSMFGFLDPARALRESLIAPRR